MEMHTVARMVDEMCYGLDHETTTDLKEKAGDYVRSMCSKLDLLAGDTDLFVVPQPDLDFVGERKGHEIVTNGAMHPFYSTHGGEYEFHAFVIYLSEREYEKYGWRTYKLTVLHELAHVETDLRYGEPIHDGDERFERVCKFMGAPVNWIEHKEMV
ncbi:putative Zn-dependent metalloprotease, SprT family [Haloarcula tailed virus 2]|uniref:Zn-dependent metalloprotease, SprT family n=1 Tax=Haloarcula tailed virus 2 TaxID=2877989 RepID=A0AAE9BZI3_9CAUD|nr:putative Zn-dependent metalloprotease, SprT family [Haloarcula tailed virus 2]UBF23246.1 putative Zn-dependent metalloprotease, SprT family [Haloarcula tailed virus 2]